MNLIAKYVVNRNNLKYIYVEKYFNFDSYEYHVYEGNKCTILPIEHFQAIYGNDLKMSIYGFLNMADVSIMSSSNDGYMVNTQNNIKKLLKELKDKNIKNPSLWGYGNMLLNIVETYNIFLNQEYKEKDLEFENNIDYEEQYQRVNRLVL